MTRRTLKKAGRGNGASKVGSSAVEEIGGVAVADSEKLAATQMLGELQVLQVQHSTLMEQRAAVVLEFDRKETEMLLKLSEKKREQSTWLRRTAAAYGIDVEAKEEKWRLDTGTWKFLRVD